MEAWIKWSLLQGLMGTSSRLLQKVIGDASRTAIHALYATALMGVVQVVYGFSAARGRHKTLFTERVNIIGAMGFGVFSVICSFLSYMTFIADRHGNVGDVGIATFLLMLMNIIPGALFDWLLFGSRLTVRQCLGIVVGLAAGFLVLGLSAPAFGLLAHPPRWVWLALANGLGMAVNRVISRTTRTIDADVNNFWIGVSTVVLAGGAILVLSPVRALLAYPQFAKLTWVSIVDGITVVPYIIFHTFAFRDGAKIALKETVFNAALLVTSTLGGMAFFHESASIWKFAGIGLFLVSFTLIRRKEPRLAVVGASAA